VTVGKRSFEEQARAKRIRPALPTIVPGLTWREGLLSSWDRNGRFSGHRGLILTNGCMRIKSRIGAQ
jgi:hypothetical protein